jgi:hypothetical protein
VQEDKEAKVMALLMNASDTNYQFNKGDKTYLKPGRFFHKVILECAR